MPEAVGCDLCGAGENAVDRELTAILKLPPPLAVVRCRRCGLVYQSPRMTESEQGAYYGEDYYLSWDHFRTVRGKLPEYHAMLDLLERYAQPPKTLCDVGCGTGEFLIAARGRGWEVQGMELSPWAAECCRTEHALEVQCTRLEDCNGEGPFGVVTMTHVAEHLASPRAGLLALNRLLRPDGLLLLEVPNELDQLLFHIADHRARRWLYNRHPGPVLHHAYFFTAGTLCSLLKQCGFRPVLVRTMKEKLWVGSRYPLGSTIKRICYHIGEKLGRGPIIQVVAEKEAAAS